METKNIKQNNIKDIAATYTMLVSRSDESRKTFSNILLTIYTPVSSGLLFLSTSLVFSTYVQKITFLITATTSVLIILSVLTERYGYFLINKTQAQSFVNHVNETGEHTKKPLYGKKWESKLVNTQSVLLPLLIIINLAAVLASTYLFVLI